MPNSDSRAGLSAGQESRAIAVKNARCCCKLRHVSIEIYSKHRAVSQRKQINSLTYLLTYLLTVCSLAL